MKVLLVSSEVFPYAKTGGLADVAGALPKYLSNFGVETYAVLPYYTKFVEGKHNLKDTGIRLLVNIDGEREVSVYEDNSYGFKTYLLRYDPYFDRDNLYGTKDGDYPDNHLRFGLFDKAVLKLAEKLGDIDLLHINDWQTGLIPLYLKHTDEFSSIRNMKVLITIHNIAYQGVFPPEVMGPLGIPSHLFNMEGIEFYGKVNFLKSGIVYSDAINTVSPTYAEEIQTPEYGYGLDGILRKRNNALFGIINGIDYEVWNPETDKHIYHNYSVKNAISGKKENKKALFKETGLKGTCKPLFGIVSRLAKQKGFDVFLEVQDKLFERDLKLVVLGSGDKVYNDLFLDLAKKYPDKIYAKIGVYDEGFARKIYASSDFFLMPSVYEPCGLGQMISMRFGTIPVVRTTGGLKDTVRDIDEPDGYGIRFDNLTGDEFLKAIDRAISLYKDTKRKNAIVKKIMKMDFSWNNSAGKYAELYEKLVKNAI